MDALSGAGAPLPIRVISKENLFFIRVTRVHPWLKFVFELNS
jgi:hypothetical protein